MLPRAAPGNSGRGTELERLRLQQPGAFSYVRGLLFEYEILSTYCVLHVHAVCMLHVHVHLYVYM